MSAIKKDKFQWLYILATLMIIIGALPIFGASQLLKIVYAIGVACYMIYYAFAWSEEKLAILERRIIHINLYASFLLLGSVLARFGILNKYGQNLWIVFLGLALVFILYANILLLSKKK